MWGKLGGFDPVGLTPPVARAIGIHQGGCSAPFGSRCAGEVTGRLVDAHARPAQVGGVALAQQSYVDDGNGFAGGTGGAQAVADALSDGCVATGLGVDCKQGMAYTTGEPGTVETRHISDSGRVRSDPIDVVHLQSPMGLLGISSSWLTGPAESVTQLDRRIRVQLGWCQSRSCDVFEIRSVVQVFIHSLFVYAPDAQRIPLSLAADWDGMIAKASKKALRIHPSATSDLIFAPVGCGGLGFQTCVAQVLANRARELQISFEGPEQQAAIRRGRWALLRESCANGRPESRLHESIEFLAAQGWYVRDAPELFLSRVASQLAQGAPGWALGGYGRPQVSHERSRKAYSSVSPLFAALRAGFARMPSASEASSMYWWASLDAAEWPSLPASPELVADAVAAALREARADWCTESRIFSCQGFPRDAALPWWDQENWQGAPEPACPRARALDSPTSMPAQCAWAATDGGLSEDICTAAFVFADPPRPVDLCAVLPRPTTWLRHQVRLPEYIGTRRCGVHEGELASLLACAARAPLGSSTQIAVDRLALIDLVDRLPSANRRDLLKANFPPWEFRLLAVLRRREAALPAGASRPATPHPAGEPSWRASSAYSATQLVHTPSHQPLDVDSVPCPFFASLNHWADLGVDESRVGTPAVSVKKPAGGPRFFFEHLGRTVIGDPAEHIREWFVADAAIHLSKHQTQGFLVARYDCLFDLDLAKWRAIRVPDGLEALAREIAPAWSPGSPLDLHQSVFRLRAGLGGSYISMVRRSPLYRRIANSIADDLDPDGHVCPLCGEAPGTRCHALFACTLCEPGLADCATPLRDRMFDFAEERLRSFGFPGASRYERGHERQLAYPAHARRYPLLHQAGWLLPTLSADGEPAENDDLASRAVIPSSLMAALMSTANPVARPLVVSRAAIDSLNGVYLVSGELNDKPCFFNRDTAAASISYSEGFWVLNATDPAADVPFVCASSASTPPAGQWACRQGTMSCRVVHAPRELAPLIPWKDRAEARAADKVAAEGRQRQRADCDSTLIGVVMHLVVVRQRYMRALGEWSQRWALRRPLVVTRPRHRPVLRAVHPCSGPSCVRTRAAGLQGRFSVGSMARCVVCREESRYHQAALHLELLLAGRGSRYRFLLLFGLVKLDALSALVALGPSFKRRPPTPSATARVAAAAGVPFLDSAGNPDFPLPLAHVLLAVPQSSPACRSSCCSAPAEPPLACHWCRGSFCAPGGSGCDKLHAAYAPGSSPSWVCPDCRQLLSLRVVRADARTSMAGSAFARRAMDALADAPADYPSSSAPLLPSV